MNRRRLPAALLSAFVAAGCAGGAGPAARVADRPTVPVPAHPTVLDSATVERVLALVPERITAEDVRATLAYAPAPRIINIQGSVPIVTMAPFAEFLIAMGYPAERIRRPRDGALSYSGYISSDQLAGEIGWYYEREGMTPILVGHSRGGMVVIRTLHELTGAYRAEVPVWNPLVDAAEPRTAIRDPWSGAERPVVGLRVGYAAALATGSLPRVILGEWGIVSKLRSIPDSAEEFTGILIEWDPIAGTLPGAEPFAATGVATVRTVMLPAGVGHIGMPLTAHLARNPVTRVWIERYTPGSHTPPPQVAGIDTTNIVHAAELWHGIKKRWCIEAQRATRMSAR